MSAAPLALGLAVGGPGDARKWRHTVERVMRAEALGFHSVWLPEGHFAPGSTPAPLLALTALAARTRRLRLGTTSLLLPIRPPLQVASEVAALDRLSGGRVWLGLGRGFRAPLFEAFGVERATKRDRFDAALDAILDAWSNGGPRPLQDPHPPLLVAAFGRKGLAQAARRGLPYLASPLEPLDRLAENFAFHRDHLPAGIDPASLPVAVMRAVHVAADDGEARRVREGLAREAERIRDALPASLARVASDGPDDAAIVGTPPEVADRVGRYRERIGLELLIVRGGIVGGAGDMGEASLERLAERVLPQLR